MTTNEAVKEEVEATTTESKPSKEVATKSNTAIATASLFEEDAGSGLENVTSDDITIPRLKILQAMSPEVNKKDGKYIEGAVAGDITNTVTKEIFREEVGCFVLPVSYRRMFLEWQPRETGGGLVTQHFDPEILRQTKKDRDGRDVLDNGNYIQTSATHYCLVLDGDSFQQVMIPMAGTQLKKSRTWNAVMASLKVKKADGGVFTPPTYSHKYKLTTVQESNDRGTWFGWNVDMVGPVTEEETDMYLAAKQFSQTVNSENVVMATSTEEAPF